MEVVVVAVVEETLVVNKVFAVLPVENVAVVVIVIANVVCKKRRSRVYI